MELLHKELSEKIIQCFFNVYNELGFGFLEKVYEKALAVELRNNNVKFEVQKPIKVYYKNETVGDYIADIVVDNKIIIEVKAVSVLNKAHEVQLVNYLKATKIKVGILVNFGEKLEFRRKVY